MLIAASKDAAFKSGIFVSAISFNLSLESVATFVLFGVADAVFKLHAFLIRTAAGGVFVMKLKLLSAYTVMTTGMICVAHVCCLSVELFCEFNNVYTMLSQEPVQQVVLV